MLAVHRGSRKKSALYTLRAGCVQVVFYRVGIDCEPQGENHLALKEQKMNFLFFLSYSLAVNFSKSISLLYFNSAFDFYSRACNTIFPSLTTKTSVLVFHCEAPDPELSNFRPSGKRNIFCPQSLPAAPSIFSWKWTSYIYC